MDIDLLEITYKKLQNLEKRVELYYSILKITNELDFILNGNYYLEDELSKILEGNY